MDTQPETEPLLAPQNEAVVPFEDGRFVVQWNSEEVRRRILANLYPISPEFAEWSQSIKDEISLKMTNIQEAQILEDASLKEKIIEKIVPHRKTWLAYASGLNVVIDPDAIIKNETPYLSKMPTQESRILLVKQLFDSVLRHESQHVRQYILDYWNGTKKIEEAVSNHAFKKWRTFNLLSAIGGYTGASTILTALPIYLTGNSNIGVTMFEVGLPLLGASLLLENITIKDMVKNYSDLESEKDAREQQRTEYFINSPLDIQFEKYK